MRTLRVAPLLLLLALPCFAAGKPVVSSEILSCTERELPCGNSIDSQLTEASCATACGERGELWSLNLFAPATLVTVTASSASFDPRLELFDENAKLIETNDNVGGTTTAQISHLLQGGIYFVRVVGQPSGSQGGYTISRHCLVSDAKNFCVPNDETLCLAGRFSFKVSATNPRGGVNFAATPRPQSELYGFFSFPAATGNADNPEVFVKLIDGRSVNDHWWIFWGGLTDLDYQITVRDNFSRTEKTFHGQGSDTSSFAGP